MGPLLDAGGIAILIAGLALGWAMPRSWRRALHRTADLASRIARRPALSILAAGLLPFAARLAVAPVAPAPVPIVADEFAHRLIGETLASGKLTNHAHPMRAHFETAYVLQSPTYTGIYQPGHGAVLAAAQVLGLPPSVGAWAAVGLMCAAICWMVQGWLPPRWGLPGAALAAVFLGRWMYDSYWGASMAATGGALVSGALPRIFRRGRVRDTALFVLGLFVLANARPYEGLLFSVVPLAAMAVWLVRRRSGRGRVALPLALFCAAAAASVLFYNWRVTGDALLLPYRLYQRQWGVPQTFLFESPVPRPDVVGRYRDLEDIYHWQRVEHDRAVSWEGFRRAALGKMATFRWYYLQPLMALPLFCLPGILRRAGMRLLLASVMLVLLGSLAYAFFFPHYVAPIAAAWIALIVQGIRHLRVWRPGGRRVGVHAVRAVSAAVLLLSAAAIPGIWAGRKLAPHALQPQPPPAMVARARLQESLGRSGKHLVMVRYRPGHLFHYGVVQNAADIDAAAVVWARELGAGRDAALLNYYRRRQVWLFEPDESPPRLTPYPALTRNR